MKKTGTQQIETRRLILRRFRVEDAESMYANWASDEEVTRYLTWPSHSSADVTKELLKQWTALYEDGGYFNWAVEWKESRQVIGNISVVRLEEEMDTAEIGYCLGRAYWGRGIMPEALRAVIDYLFDEAGIGRITAGHDIQNPKSGRVMQKAGMTKEGIHRRAGRNNRGICDMVCYSILPEDRSGAGHSEPVHVEVRFAREEELERINELRRQVNDLHVEGKPDVFKPGFSQELRDFIHVIWADPEQKIAVALSEGTLCGFAVLHHIVKGENPFMHKRDFLDIDEFCVDQNFRRRGVGSAMIRFIHDFAREQGHQRIELNMWEFNRDALAFYEAAGFRTYRRFMEVFL